MAPDSELLSKRRRLAPSDRANPTSPTTISNVVLRKWSPHTSANASSHGPAKYCPSDRPELLRRLATFQELTDWTPKPDRVSEIEWAKRGWVCQGSERVRCTLCNKELVVKLNKKEVDGKEVSVLVPSDIEDALVSKYVELMVDAHLEECLWRKRGCDDSLLRISFTNSNTSFEALRHRYDELCSRQASLPYEFNLRLPPELDIDAILAQVPSDFFSHPPPKEGVDPKSPNRVALALAVMGWQGLSNARIGAVPNSASCHTCLRRLGLWMFKSKEVGANGNVIVPAAMDHLDPAREHRFFCPWKNAQTQRLGSAKPNPETDLPAWKALVHTIHNEAYLRGMLEERPRTKVHPAKANVATATAATPKRGEVDSPSALGASPSARDSPLIVIGPMSTEDDEAVRDARDKERWARLRKVKSLFDTKAGKKLRRTISRPGTAASTASFGGK